MRFLYEDCCHSRPELLAGIRLPDVSAPVATASPAQERPFNVLFVCTGNSARSIFAQALLEDLGGKRFKAYSAGTRPYPVLNPLTVEVLRSKGYETDHLVPQDLQEFLGHTSPKMDFVFTVCDHAANEECPPLPGQPVSAHWGMVDPVKAQGSPAERALAFQQSFGMMKRRLAAFVALPLTSLSRLSLQAELDEIGGEEMVHPAAANQAASHG